MKQLPCVLALFASGCSSIYVSEDEFAHMICVDEQGAPADVRPRGLAADVDITHEQHVETIVAAFHRWQEQDRENNHRMMLVIHGGLVTMSQAVDEARRTMAAMGESDERFFPVFVNWETGPFQSYWDHLMYVRDGRQRPLTAMATSPFVLLYDFGRAIVRYPITLLSQTVNMRDYHYYGDGSVEERPMGWSGQAEIDLSPGERDFWSAAGDVTFEFVPGAARLATTPILDGVGVSMFLNMRRRARMLIRRDEDFGQGERNASGALSLLMRELIRSTARRGDKRPVEMTIIGHSMGCIVANGIVREFGYRQHPLAPEETRGDPIFRFRDIVFMGAACTIREFTDTTLHYVLQHDDATFYNLCLHPRDEEDDVYGFGLLPFGSLLEWIDDYITIQNNEMDRTLGKWNNVARVLRVMDWIPKGQRKRVFVKGFARKQGDPRDHGDFNDVEHRYWERAFWTPVKR